MTCNIIATGSTGNAIQLDGNILLDCGIPYKAVEPIASRLNLVLLTHRHVDHFKKSTIGRLAQEHPLLRFGCCQWLVLPLVECGVDPRRIDRYDPRRKAVYTMPNGSLIVEPVALFHDVPNCGYKITLHSGEKVLYATDTGTMDGIQAKDFNYYLIEANHDFEELQSRANEKMSRGEFAYEIRAAENHLSKQQTDEWLMDNMAPWSEIIYLHQHKEKMV